MHFRILKIIATSGFLTALECIKFDFRPDPVGGAYSVPPDPLTGLIGLLLRVEEGGKGTRRRGGEGGKEVGEGQGTGNGREWVWMPGKGEGRGGEGRKGREGEE